MKILVTGATGYVGGRLVKYLSSAGHEVVGVSRRQSDLPLGWPKSVAMERLDALNLTDISVGLFQDVEAVIHLAAANEIRSTTYPDEAMQETGGGTRRLINACIDMGVRRFIFMSTVHVYGAPLQGNYNESSLPRPSHPYSISHKVGEDYVRAAHMSGKIEGISVRLSNSIGAPAWTSVDRWTLVGNDFCRQAIQNGEIVIKSPNQWRDFVPLNDVCAGIEILIHARASALGDGIFNLSGELPMRIIEIAKKTKEAVQKVTGKSVVLQASNSIEPAGTPTYQISVDKLKTLGYKPSGVLGLEVELIATASLVNTQMTTYQS